MGMGIEVNGKGVGPGAGRDSYSGEIEGEVVQENWGSVVGNYSKGVAI
jgi:hypothetical protein